MYIVPQRQCRAYNRLPVGDSSKTQTTGIVSLNSISVAYVTTATSRSYDCSKGDEETFSTTFSAWLVLVDYISLARSREGKLTVDDNSTMAKDKKKCYNKCLAGEDWEKQAQH
jgi:hypothetical protein